MSIALHWYLPTHGDGRTLVQAGAAAQLLQETRRPDSAGTGREATVDYLAQVARAAEESGFDAALTPTGTTCHDAWITCAALSQVVDRLRFLVAFRPGSISPTLAAQQAATFQRHTGGRLALNIVTGGDDEEQRRFGDSLSKDERYARTDEFLTILRGAWSGAPFDFHGEHLWTEGAVALGMEEPPEIYFGGASDAALRVAARHADVALTWGDPPPRLAPHLDKVRDLADAAGREVRFGIRLHVIARDTSDEAWAAADALIADADEPPSPPSSSAWRERPRRASAGCARFTTAGARASRSIPTSGPGSGCCGPAPGPPWSVRTRRSPTSWPSTTSSASPSSSSPAIPTSRRPMPSARAWCRCCAGAGSWASRSGRRRLI